MHVLLKCVSSFYSMYCRFSLHWSIWSTIGHAQFPCCFWNAGESYGVCNNTEEYNSKSLSKLEGLNKIFFNECIFRRGKR